MAALIKNQILKHLSRYAKNLSSDKINLSTFKGEGELRNLELDQEVMTELLSLPTWMKLTHATCNHVLVRIPWTKLKSVPIHLSLDEVNIRVEACEELRNGGEGGQAFTSPSFGKYGFVNKVIDGVTATVNSVEITFFSKEFESKVQISRIRVESRSPSWNKVDLSGTRLKDMVRGETLIFKEMEWQTLRLEARSTSDSHLAPLRLLANQAKARIVMKKRLNDSQVLGCRLSLILDDLLWVLTDSQILAALHFVKSLSGLVKQSTETTQRIKAARKLETLPEYQAQISQSNAVDGMVMTKFDQCDVKETSYHFLCDKIDLHLCDDPGSGRSQHPDLKDGGALQLSLNQVMLDFYPYHLAKGSRRFWQKYSPNTLAQWLQQALQNFKISLIDSLSTESMHSPLIRTQAQGQVQSKGFETNCVKEEITARFGKLMSSCLVVKIQDLSLYRVTTSSKRTSPLPFISTFIERPKDLPVIHGEFSWFYYPGEICFPLPCPKYYAYLHPIQIQLDVCTILWFNSFVSNLNHTMTLAKEKEEPDYADVRVEMIMPKIVFESTCDYTGQKDRPKSLHVQTSRLILSNYRSSETGTLHDLTRCIELYQRGDLVYGSSFPSKAEDIPLLQEKFVEHAEGRDKLRSPKKLNCSNFTEIAGDLTQDLLWTDPRDIWFIHLDVWADFHIEEMKTRHPSESTGSSKPKGKTGRFGMADKDFNTLIYPFIDPIPLSAWIYADTTSRNQAKNVHALFNTTRTGKIQITHYQFLFLMRMIEAISELSLYLTLDSRGIAGDDILQNVTTFLGWLKSLEVSLLFPPVTPEKHISNSVELDSGNQESSSGDQLCETNQEICNGNVENTVDKASILFQKCVIASPLSGSPMARSLGGGSNPNLGTSANSGIGGISQNIKHSLTNLAVTFNKGGGVSTPDSEVVSNWSNISSDSSDNFVQLDVGEPDGSNFPTNTNRTGEGGETDWDIEVAVEVEENSFVDEPSTPSPACVSHDVSIMSRVDPDYMTSVLTVQLNGIEIAQEGHGLSSIIKVQCKTAELLELAEIPYKEFQEKFSGRVKDDEVKDFSGNPTQRRALKMRLEQQINGNGFLQTMNSDEIITMCKSIITPANPRINLSDRPGSTSPVRSVMQSFTSAFLDAKVDFTNEPDLKLHMTTCIGLSDLLEDEILPHPIPMRIELLGVNLELIEDRPPANITSPGSVPIKLGIPNLLQLSRDERGVFRLGSTDCNSLTESIGHLTAARKTKEDDTEKEYLKKELEKTLGQLHQYQQRNIALEQELEENECLKGLIVSLQDEVCKLQRERSELLRKYQHNYH